MARKYEMKNSSGKFPDNGGQVLEEYFEHEDIDISGFERRGGGKKIRKAKLRLPDDVSIPVAPSNKEVKEDLDKMIEDGRYAAGEMIVPQTFEIMTMDGDEIKIKTFEVSGRKFPIDWVKEEMNKAHRNFFRLKPDEFYESLSDETRTNEFERMQEQIGSVDQLKILQRQRTIACWHDGSPISNASHLLVMFCAIYDPAIFLKDDEYFKETGEETSVQAEVEMPIPYILARCPSSGQQLMYSDVRLKDVMAWNKHDCKVLGVNIVDRIRFFKGDAPACQVEAGHQKGGHYFCWSCDVKADRNTDIGHTLQAKHQTLQDRIDVLIATSHGRRCVANKSIDVLERMKVNAVVRDLMDRDVQLYGDEKADDYRKMLAEAYHGIHHLPFLLYGSKQTKLAAVGLEDYEVLGFEPLHGISGHIKNIYLEIPKHLKDNEKDLFDRAVKASFGSKQVKRAKDYRQSLIDVIQLVKTKIEPDFLELMKQIAEIQEIAYADDKDRDIVKILRFHNVTFMHAMLMKKLMPIGKKLTTRKLYGQYEHNIVREAAIQYRLVALTSCNTENEERAFTFFKDVSKKCTNHLPDNVIKTCLTRWQVRKDWKEHLGSKISTGKNSISEHGQKLKEERTNTVVPFDLIKDNVSDWQAHLERISDFLECDVWEEKRNGIEFFDLSKAHHKTYPSIHHFRSSSTEKEHKYLADKWSKLEDRKLPAFLRLEEDGKKRIVSSLNKPNPYEGKDLSKKARNKQTSVSNINTTKKASKKQAGNKNSRAKRGLFKFADVSESKENDQTSMEMDSSECCESRDKIETSPEKGGKELSFKCRGRS
ncbi:uncharacterized protein [Clytia hemisphaerica]|uniref:uncharacterized protein n=1 Tax=Clytia hemisphaerica TaxID=252671 RepID=UPI0034D42F12